MEKDEAIWTLIRQGDAAFETRDGPGAHAAWRRALDVAPMRLRAQIISRLGLGKSARGDKLLRALQALEDLFPGETPFVADGMAVWHKLNPFIADPVFRGLVSKQAHLLPLANWHWHLQTVAWAVQQVRDLPGDFVELGVFRGHTTAVVAEYVGFETWDRRWWLYDTFEGIPDDQLDHGWAENNATAYNASTFSFEEVRDRFAGYPNITVIKGRVPEILDEGAPDSIAFLHMDMNNLAAEIAALEALMGRIVPGGVIVFDDYGWTTSHAQHWAEKAWFKERGMVVLELPTGQGVFVKPR